MEYFYWPFRGGAFFVGRLCCLCLVFVVLTRLFVAALWSPAKGGGGGGLTSWLLLVMSNCNFITFPCSILGQVWYMIVLIPDLCRLSYFLYLYIYLLITRVWGPQMNRLMDAVLLSKQNICFCWEIRELISIAYSDVEAYQNRIINAKYCYWNRTPP